MPLPIVLDAYRHGFKATFRYDPILVENIKKALGFEFNKDGKFWWSAGPEVLLDMERFGIPYVPTREAEAVIEDFRKRIYVIGQLKQETVEGQFGYQTIGTHLLITQQRAILADDMGLGKSKQALDALAMVWPRLKNRRALVVAPKTLTYNWYDPENEESEFVKWHPELPAVNIPEKGPKKRAEFYKNLLKNDEFIIVTNYEKLRASDFPRIQFDVVILDEATKFKNSQTATWDAVEQYTSQAKYVWALTGTPLEIRLTELYSIMKAVRPAVFGPFTRFRNEHLQTDFMGNVTGSKNHELLKERYGPWITRRTKTEVAKWLPPKLPPNFIYLDMNKEERASYELLIDDFEQWASEQGASFSSFSALVQLVRMQQFCCSQNILNLEAQKGTKFEYLRDGLIDQWNGLVVVFTQYREMGDRLLEWLGCHPEAYVHGNQGKEAVRRGNAFSKGDLGKVLISTDAGAYGLNIVGADLIVHYDQTWNPMKHRQREDRLWRTGQTKPVNVAYMIYKDSIDQAKRAILEMREALVADIVDDVEAFTKMRFNQRDFMKIIRGEYRGERKAA